MRKSFDKCFITVYLPERTIEALTRRLNDASDHWDKSRSAYIAKSIHAMLISEGFGHLLGTTNQEKTESELLKFIAIPDKPTTINPYNIVATIIQPEESQKPQEPENPGTSTELAPE